MSGTGPQFRVIGQRMPILEDRRFVRGRGRYIGDLELPGMLHLSVAGLPVAHARLLSVDVSEARNAPGVVAVLTGRDIPAYMDPIPQELDLPKVVWYPLAIDKVRSAGEWTAAVVAVSRAAAEDAAELVAVEYEELPPVVDPESAMLPQSALVHEEHGSNVIWAESYTWGDVDAAFAAADRVFDFRYRWNRSAGVPLETFGCVAAQGPSGMLDIWASHQNPDIQQEMMAVLRRPLLRVHMDLDVGGSYGAKRGRKQMYLTAVAALATGRPVKFLEDRIQNMEAGDGHGPDRIYRVKVGVNDDGLLQAVDIHLIDDEGAYSGRGPRQIGKPITAVVGPYRVRNVRYGGYGVLTNKTNQVPFRGAGQSPHNFALERMMDETARELGLDRIELRRRNYIQYEEFPYEIPSGAVYDSGNYEGAMRLAVEKAELEALRAEQGVGRKSGRLLGIGIAGAIEPSGGLSHPESARIQVDEKGRVVVAIGFQSAGQSHESMVAQVVSEELGIAPEEVIVQREHGLGGVVGGATTGSRMTLMLGGALVAGTKKIREKLKLIAAQLLEADPDDIVAEGSQYHVAGTETSVNMTELAAIAYRRRELLPPGMEPGLVEDATFGGPPDFRLTTGGRGFASYGFAVHIPVVEVDPETYEIRILRYVVVHDCGTVLNPLAVEGFVYGGIGHGIGGALYERFVYDESGTLRTISFMDYLMPTAAEIPHMELYSISTPSPLHPYGAKGTAEGGYMTSPAAVASAVEDALAPLGVKVDEVPITPEIIFRKVSSAATSLMEPRSLAVSE